MRLIRLGQKVMLVDREQTLASLVVVHETDQTLNIKDWRAKVRGKGYGRMLIKLLVKQKPNLWSINTDGFTQSGKANLLKALPNFKIINWRYSGAGAIGTLWRQDAIDANIERKETTGRRRPWAIDPALHSQRKVPQ